MLGYAPPMLYMVIERFKNPDLKAVGERFTTRGRPMPNEVKYLASWLEPSGARCFQVMESPTREAVDVWINNWSDLVDFEVAEVLTSAEFWARRSS
jgi:hypothetical protein